MGEQLAYGFVCVHGIPTYRPCARCNDSIARAIASEIADMDRRSAVGAIDRMMGTHREGSRPATQPGETDFWEMVEQPVGGFADRPGQFSHRNCPAVVDQWKRTRLDGGYDEPPKAQFCPDCGAKA